MSEFTANTYMTSNGNKNGNSRVGPMVPTNGHKMSRTEEEEDEELDRGHWGSKAEFILSCIGFSVGIGNVWRFPYLAYKNGGAAFLLPYFILLIFVGKPMYYLETAIGQFSRLSPLHVWRCAPIAKGVGFGMIILSLVVSIYYNVIMSYSLIYVGASFVGTYDDLPWTTCGEWSDKNCIVPTNETNDFLGLERCKPAWIPGVNNTENCTELETPAKQYWERFVLNITKDIGEPGDLGGFNYPIPLALLLSWIVVFLCLMKGVKSSGKVVYFTATFPYVILIALLVRGVTLPGATIGLKKLFVPDFTRLGDFQVWKDAASQMFFSLGISWGGLMMFGSYNKFHNKINRDAAFVSSLDFLTSIIASCVIFSVLGNLSQELGIDIDQVADAGQGLAFVVYPTALAKLPLPWLWSVLFFFMLFFLGLDSQFALLETALTAVYDGFPKMRKHKVKITAISCICCYLLGLPCASNAGQYVLDIMDTYASGTGVLFIAFWEIVGFMWIYGYKKFCMNLKLMLGQEPGWFWKITWTIVSPLFLLAIVIISLVQWQEPKYNKVIPYPDWAHAMGWALVALSAVQIPLWAVLMTIYYAIKGRISQVVKPTPQWGPGDKQVRQQLLDEMGGIPRVGNYAYDNNGMGYEAYHM